LEALRRKQSTLQLNKVKLLGAHEQDEEESTRLVAAAARLQQEIIAAEKKIELCRKQVNRLKTEEESERSKQRALTQLFTSSYLGIGITESLSDASLQSNF